MAEIMTMLDPRVLKAHPRNAEFFDDVDGIELKPMPEKKTKQRPAWTDKSYDYIDKGWNACIDEILGEKGEKNDSN